MSPRKAVTLDEYLARNYPTLKRDRPAANDELRSADEHGGFELKVFGYFDIKPDEKEKLVKAAHEELYQDLTGKPAPSNATPGQIRKELEANAGTKLNIRFVAIHINQENRAASFANHLDHIEKFLGPSAQRLIGDAVKELSELSTIAAGRNDPKFTDKSALCSALLKIQLADVDRDPKLFANHQSAFENLKKSANLAAAFSSAEKRLLNDVGGNSAEYPQSDRPRYMRSDDRENRGRDDVR